MALIKPIGSYSGEFTVLQSGDYVDAATLGSGTATANTVLLGTNTWGTVPNGALTNNSLTIGSTSVALGATVTTFAGLVSVTSTTFVGALTGNSTTSTSTTNTAITDDPSTAATMYLTWVTATSGNLPQKVSSTKLTFIPSTGTLSSTAFSGNGASLTSLTAGNLAGTIPSGVLGNSALFIGTTSIALNRTTAAQALTGITSIDGSAATWTTGRTITLTGDATGVSAAFNGSANLSFATAIADATVTGKLLTGWGLGANTSIASTDSILGAFGKIQGQIDSTYGGTLTGSYKFNTGTTAVDPTTGKLAFNNAAYASVTNIYISQTSDPGTDAENLLKALAVGDVIYVQERDNATKWLRGKISSTPTDNGTWWTLPITLVSNGAGAMISNNAKCAITVSLGDSANGTVTSVSVTTANGVSGSVATSTTTPAITLTLGAITPTSVAATGAISGTTLSSSGTSSTANLGSSFSSTDISGAAQQGYGLRILSTVNQTSTALYTDLLVNRTQIAAGSGAQRLLDLQVGSVSRFSVSSTGALGINNNTPAQKLDILAGALRFTYLSAPTAPTVALAGVGAGSVPNGTYVYKVTYVNAMGDSVGSATSSSVTVTDNTTNGRVTVTIPVSSDPSVTNRRLFRSNNAGSTWLAFSISTINNNTTTTYQDNTASPPDNFGAWDFARGADSGSIYANAIQAIAMDSYGNIEAKQSFSTNGGRATDNNGKIALGVGMNAGTKGGIFVTDNFNFGSGGYISSVISDNTNANQKNAYYGQRSAGNYSVNINSRLGWTGAFEQDCIVGAVNAGGMRVMGITNAVLNTGTSYSYSSYNYHLGTTSGSYVGYHSTGFFATTGSTVTDHKDFQAGIWGSAGGTVTNRYGVYLDLDNTGTTTAWGIYQTASATKNYFNGKVGIGVLPTSNALEVTGTVSATTFSGSGASLTSIPAGQLTGTIPTGVLGNSSLFIGTTSITLNRASSSQALTGITSIDGSAATWTTGRTITLTGDATGVSGTLNGSANLSFATTISDATVTGKLLTGYTTGSNTALAATDTILTAMGKIQGQINAVSSANGTVTSVGGTGTVSGLTLTGTVTTTGNLTLGGTLAVTASNFASQTANFALIAPSGSAGVPTFRQLELSDIPDAWTKKSVRAATTANITLSGTQTVDGIALVATDRCLVKNQTTTQDNGIYIVNAGAWTRAFGADTASEVAGATVHVDSGTQGGYLYRTTFKSTDTLGTTTMPWYQNIDASLAGTVVGTTLGTAAIGTSLFYARQDHVHPSQTTITGNAGTATSLAGGTANQIPYQTGVGATAFYSGANYGVQTYTATGVPSSVAGAAGVLQGSASVIPTFTTTPTLTGTNFTGIPNGALTNSAVTIGSTSVSLGATVTTFAGLTSVTSTTFVGSLTGSATQLGGVAAASYALKADTHFIGTTSIALNRASAAQSLTGITSIDGTASAWTTGRTFALSGDVTGTSAAMTGAGNLSWAVAISDATVTGKVLTGYTAGANTALAATDTILAAMGKLQGQITARSGTVTSVSVTTANGVSGSVATATSTPAITITLGAITPTSVAATGALSGTTLTVGSGTTTSDVIIAGAMNRDRAGALTTAAVTLVDLDTWAAATYRSAKYVIQAVDTVSGHVYFTEVMVTKDNSNNVYVTEYATVVSGTNIIALSADYDGTTNVRLRVTPASANSTQIKFRATIFNI